MKRMSSQIENIVNAYKTLTKIPALNSARILRAGKTVSSRWSERNVDRGKSTLFTTNSTLNENLEVVGESEFPVDTSNEILSAVSPSERYRAVIRDQTDGKDAKKQYLEIWQSRLLTHCVDLAALEIHGDVYADSEFGSLSWSPDEKKLVYVAEKKLVPSEPYIKRQKANKKTEKTEDSETPTSKGEHYVYKQDWGEQLVGKYLSVIVVCQLETETFTIVEGIPKSWCPGQVLWSPNGSLVGVAWETEPRRLGLIYCTNRPGSIFDLTLDGKLTTISESGKAVRSPRFSPDGSRLVWLQRQSGGPHHACHQLVQTKWPLQDKAVPIVAVDIIQKDFLIQNNEKFYGIYSQALPKRGFTTDGKRILFSTPQNTEVRSYVFNFETNKFIDISDKSSACSTTILDVSNNIVLASRSSLTQPSQLIIAQIPEAGDEKYIVWKSVGSGLDVPDVVKISEVHYLNLAHDNNDAVQDFSAIYFAPARNGDKTLPLVVWPHGGPHSNFVNSYSLEAALFSMLGFASLQINYRGSTGNGEVSINFLPKLISKSDVLDCKYASEQAVKQFPVDSKRLVLFGGSHGGFLVTHLSGQYPDDFAAVSARNPVTDIASMFNNTDISDWCAVEAGYPFTEEGPLTEEFLLELRRVSPLVHAHKVKTPTAIMLGSIDKRVPYYQGLEYYRRIKANGCKAKLYLYEDTHALATLPVEMDNLINSIAWFIQHTE